MHTRILALAAATLIIAGTPAVAFEPLPRANAVNYSPANGVTVPGSAATPIPGDKEAAICQTPISWCVIWGPPSWGQPCWCYNAPGYQGYTNG